MTIEKTVNEGKLCLKVSGHLDTTTAPQLDAELQADLKEAAEIQLDFEELEYISSAGLRVLLSAQKGVNAAGGVMKLVHVNGDVLEVFNITGFSDILTIE